MHKELCRNLNYHFKDEKLLKIALTHRSSQNLNNERLEFLGDSVVNLIIAEALFHQFPKSSEGDLSRWRASLINRETLAEVAKSFDLGKYLYLGLGEIKSGGSQRSSILSCGMEAVIGAIYLDSDFLTIKKCIMEWYAPLLQGLSNAASHKDPKTMLQEYLQGSRKPLPQYVVMTIEGEAHKQTFTLACIVEGVEKVLGSGTSRRRAEQDAAEKMLRLIKK